MGEAFAFVNNDTNKTATEFDDDSSNYYQLLSSLNLHWKKHLMEKSLWVAEKLELQSKINMLEGQLRSYASVNIELVERIRILESALLLSRGEKRTEPVSIVPEQFQPDLTVTDLLTKKQIQRGRHVLQNYLNELNIIDSCIKQMDPKPMIDRDFVPFNNQIKHISSNTLKSSKSKNGKDRYLTSEAKNEVSSSKNKTKLKSLEDDELSFDGFPVVDSLTGKPASKNKLKILKNQELDKKKEQKSSSSDFDIDVINDLENIFEIDDILTVADNSLQNGRTRSKTITPDKSYTWITTNTFWGHTEIVRTIDFHPTTKYLASGSDDGLVCIWNFDDSSKLELSPTSFLRGHSSPVLCCLFNHIGDLLYSSDLNGIINVWSVSEEKILQTYKYSNEAIWSISYDLQSNLLLSMSADGTCCLWKPSQATPFDHFNPYTETTDDDVQRRFLGAYFNTHNNNQVICISSKDIVIYDLPEKQVINIIDPFKNSQIESSDPSLDHITCYSHNIISPCLIIGCKNTHAHVIDLNDGSTIKSFIPHSFPISTISYESNYQNIATGDVSGSIHVWDKNYTCIQSINSAHRTKVSDGVTSVTFHKTLKFMASCGSDDFIKLYI